MNGSLLLSVDRPIIKAVIFDFGNVIQRFDHMLFVRGIAPYSSLSMERLTETVTRKCSDLVIKYETGLITSGIFFSEMSQRCELSAPEPVFVKAFTEIFAPIPETSALIRALKPGYKLGLLSNTNEWHYRHGIQRSDIFHLFDTVTLSFEVRSMKPDAPIYRDALAKLKEQPRNCIYIDDLKENADAASRLGMQAIHYTDPQALESALKKHGVA